MNGNTRNSISNKARVATTRQQAHTCNNNNNKKKKNITATIVILDHNGISDQPRARGTTIVTETVMMTEATHCHAAVLRLATYEQQLQTGPSSWRTSGDKMQVMGLRQQISSSRLWAVLDGKLPEGRLVLSGLELWASLGLEFLSEPFKLSPSCGAPAWPSSTSEASPNSVPCNATGQGR